jgi:hypothetical protein
MQEWWNFGKEHRCWNFFGQKRGQVRRNNMTKSLPTGWIWSVLLAAGDAQEDLRQLCTDYHERDDYCSFCRSATRIRHGLKRARNQLFAIQARMDKQAARQVR